MYRRIMNILHRKPELPRTNCPAPKRPRLRSSGKLFSCRTVVIGAGWILPLCLIANAGLASPAAELHYDHADAVYPTVSWQSKSPAEVGMDKAKLDALRNYVGGRGCVVRHGYMVYTWGDPGRRADVASACKPWFTHFLFSALEEKKISGLDEKVSKWQPRLKNINKNLGYKDSQITWRHMANQVSCYGVNEKPGTAFCYNDWQMALFWDTLFLKVYGAAYDNVDAKVLRPGLTDVLQCEDSPTFMAFGTRDRPGRLAISVRDFARFGLLYLRKGNWKGRQLISAEHASMAVTSSLPNSIPRAGKQATEMLPGRRSLGSRDIPDNQTDHFGSYSFAWWTNGIDRHGKRHWPDVPHGAYGAFGHGGPRAMVVIPSLGLVIAWNDARVRTRDMENQALKLLTDSVLHKESQGLDVGPQPGQVIVHPQHPQWLKRKGGGPLFICGPGDPENFLYRGKRNPDGTRTGDQTTLINKLKGTGANCIYLMAVRSHGGDGDRTHNPFKSNNPSEGINPKVLDQWETWFTEMDNNGIVILFFFYDDSASIWNTGDKVGAAEKRFIHALVNRFEHHKNLIWCVAEEYQEAFSPQRVRRIAAEIRAADDHDHVIAVHKLSGLDFSEFADDPCIDQFAIQYNQSISGLHNGVVTAWNEAAGRYSLNMAEPSVSGTPQGFCDRHTMRKCSWACAMGGAYVMIFSMSIDNTPLNQLKDCGRLVRFFESTNFNEMSPHDELKYAQTEYVLARPGHSYIAYASNLKGRIGLRNMTAGAYTLRWFDCATGKSVTQQKRVGAGNQTWPTPPGIGSELALYLRRTGE